MPVLGLPSSQLVPVLDASGSPEFTWNFIDHYNYTPYSPTATCMSMFTRLTKGTLRKEIWALLKEEKPGCVLDAVPAQRANIGHISSVEHQG